MDAGKIFDIDDRQTVRRRGRLRSTTELKNKGDVI
jgi:hypothetical protein